MEQLAVDADVVARGVGLGAKLGDDCAVDLDAAAGDQLFGVAAAGDAGLGKDLLQALELGRGGRGLGLNSECSSSTRRRIRGSSSEASSSILSRT